MVSIFHSMFNPTTRDIPMTTFSTYNQDVSEHIYSVINRLPPSNRLDTVSPISFLYSILAKADRAHLSFIRSGTSPFERDPDKERKIYLISFVRHRFSRIAYFSTSQSDALRRHYYSSISSQYISFNGIIKEKKTKYSLKQALEKQKRSEEAAQKYPITRNPRFSLYSQLFPQRERQPVKKILGLKKTRVHH